MVVCIEFTRNNDFCRPAQHLFMNLAREFEIPFFRATIEQGKTYDMMRRELGGVEYTPTILVVFYGPNGNILRAKYEKEETREVSRIKGAIKELLEKRGKLKMAERVAEGLAQGLAQHMQSQISRERKVREEYEAKLQRQMEEKEEEVKRKDEEKKKQEEEELERDKKFLLAKEKLREMRPQHLEELRKMNLDSAPAKDIKNIMEKMHISTVGCINRSDLKEKLVQSVPELKFTTTTTGGDSGEVKGLKKVLAEANSKLLNMTVRAKRAEDLLRPLEGQVASLQKQVASLRAGKNATTNLEDGGKVRRLEETLSATRMLYTTNLSDFEIIQAIAENDKMDSVSLVLRVKCIKEGIPNPGKIYAMKFLANFLHESSQTEVNRQFRNEYDILCRLPSHENIINMWAFFYDRPSNDILKRFKSPVSGSHRTLGLFILMDEHPMNTEEQLAILADSRGPLSSKVVEWLKDLLCGLVFLEKHSVIHRDLKLNNLLLTAEGRLAIGDFGKATILDRSFKLLYRHGQDIGGNQAHLAPEILNCKAGPKSSLDYSKQPVWAAGLLAYELAGHKSPFATGIIDQRGYHVDQLPALKTTHCSSSPAHCQVLPTQLTRLVEAMLQFDPIDRPSLQHCLEML